MQVADLSPTSAVTLSDEQPLDIPIPFPPSSPPSSPPPFPSRARPRPLATASSSSTPTKTPQRFPLRQTMSIGHMSRRIPMPLSLPSNTLSVESSSPPSFLNDQIEPVEILPYLFLGSEIHASSKAALDKLGITADYFIYKCIPVEDSGAEDIAIYFPEAIEYIESIRQQNGKILVHCQAGISRSSTICMAYLMETQKYRMEEAYEFVKSRRRCVSPNFNFMEQLLTFENQVFQKDVSDDKKPKESSPSDVEPSSSSSPEQAGTSKDIM